MAFLWWDYLDAADRWLKEARAARQGREALLRSSISRAYYAACMSCREYLSQKYGFKAPVFSTHDAIKKELELRMRSAPGLGQVWVSIGRMQKLRSEADYSNEFKSTTLPDAAQQCIDDAMDIRSALRALK